ncbi:MAG: type pilus assembly protein PilC [Paraburkholderia sp.]|nr:type pilus assembly protein PilC [Paraburkholderia sp.]
MNALAQRHSEPADLTERRFAWRGVELDGRRRRGIIVAANAAGARAMLRRQDVVVVALVARGKAAQPKASAREVTGFTRQLSSLLRAGVPLAQALELIGQAPGNDIPRIANSLARSIADGTRFAEALSRFPTQFDALYCQLAAVGEASGSLALALARMAEERERTAALRAKARAALAYPVAVLLFAIAITAALLVWVVPAFRHVFESFGADLPAPTRAVIALSDAGARAGVPILTLIAIVHIIAVWTVRRSPAARLALHRIVLTAPIAGPVWGALSAARWSRGLGTLLAAGTPLADALSSLTQVTGNAVFDRASDEIAVRLGRGERLAAAMRAVGCFAPSIVQPVAVAEECGALDTMLLDAASHAEREAHDRLGMLASVAEPLVVIVLGALIGGLVVALYLPVIELGNVV